MKEFLGLVIVAALAAGMAACSVADEGSSRRSDGDVRQATAPRQTTLAKAHAGGSSTQEGPAAGQQSRGLADAPATWEYVALGDSLAAGVGARKGYVERYAARIGSDTGARVEVLNLGVSGQTSSELLHVLRTDGSTRRAIGAAEVVTFNIGLNDLGRAGEAYEGGVCGGDDGQDCLRAAVEELEENWDAIVAEILGLRSTEDAVIRTAGIGYTPRVGDVFEPYVAEANRHVAATSAARGVPYAQPTLGEGRISSDGVHPNDAGYEAIADGLRGLRYDPLFPPR